MLVILLPGCTFLILIRMTPLVSNWLKVWVIPITISSRYPAPNSCFRRLLILLIVLLYRFVCGLQTLTARPLNRILLSSCHQRFLPRQSNFLKPSRLGHRWLSYRSLAANRYLILPSTLPHPPVLLLQLMAIVWFCLSRLTLRRSNFTALNL